MVKEYERIFDFFLELAIGRGEICTGDIYVFVDLLVFGLKVIVLANPGYHFEGGRPDGIHLYLAQLFVILGFEGRYFFYDLNEVDQKLFELFDAGQSVALVQLDAVTDMFGHGLEVPIVTLDQRAEL